jgi:hypothetical protein
MRHEVQDFCPKEIVSGLISREEYGELAYEVL